MEYWQARQAPGTRIPPPHTHKKVVCAIEEVLDTCSRGVCNLPLCASPPYQVGCVEMCDGLFMCWCFLSKLQNVHRDRGLLLDGVGATSGALITVIVTWTTCTSVERRGEERDSSAAVAVPRPPPSLCL